VFLVVFHGFHGGFPDDAGSGLCSIG
jgi:hypothetical protein